MKYLLLSLLMLCCATSISAQTDSLCNECEEGVKPFNLGLEFSVSPRSKGYTPILISPEIKIPVKRIQFSAGYQYMLVPFNANKQKTFYTSHGLFAAAAYRLFCNGNGRKYWLLGKKESGYLKFKYARNVGKTDFAYDMYDLGLFEESNIFGSIKLGIGVRYIDSRSVGIKDFCSVFFSVGL